MKKLIAIFVLIGCVSCTSTVPEDEVQGFVYETTCDCVPAEGVNACTCHTNHKQKWGPFYPHELKVKCTGVNKHGKQLDIYGAQYKIDAGIMQSCVVDGTIVVWESCLLARTTHSCGMVCMNLFPKSQYTDIKSISCHH